MKNILNDYYKPTPLRMRKIGDALLGASMTMSTYAIMNNYPKVGVVIMVIGGLGKFISNLWSADDIQESPKP